MLRHLLEKRLPLFLEFLSAFRRYASYIQEIIYGLLLILFLGAILIWRYENIDFGDAIYFTCITGLTIGYGDITPETTIGKIVSVGIGLIGMLAVGLSVAIATRALNDTAVRHFEIEREDQATK